MNALETHGLTKDYGVSRGIFDLNIAVEEGEAFGFIGPNGAGKTTTLRLLMNFIRPSSGSATLLGLDAVRDSVAVKKLTGYLPAEAPDYPNQTGAKILDLLAHLRGGVDDGRVSELAKRFDLDLKQKYRRYSHGNKQKVWLIQAFMHRPKLLLLDEPTTGLDPIMQQSFRELLAEAKKDGATIFLSSHVLPEVQEICDRIGVVHQGRVRKVGTMSELRLSSAHRVTATLTRPLGEDELKNVPGVSEVAIAGNLMRCTVNGPMGPLVTALKPDAIDSFDSAEMSLEEVFLEQYGHEES